MVRGDIYCSGLQHNEGTVAGSDFHLAGGGHAAQIGQIVVFIQEQFLTVEADAASAAL